MNVKDIIIGVYHILNTLSNKDEKYLATLDLKDSGLDTDMVYTVLATVASMRYIHKDHIVEKLSMCLDNNLEGVSLHDIYDIMRSYDIMEGKIPTEQTEQEVEQPSEPVVRRCKRPSVPFVKYAEKHWRSHVFKDRYIVMKDLVEAYAKEYGVEIQESTVRNTLTNLMASGVIPKSFITTIKPRSTLILNKDPRTALEIVMEEYTDFIEDGVLKARELFKRYGKSPQAYSWALNKLRHEGVITKEDLEAVGYTGNRGGGRHSDGSNYYNPENNTIVRMYVKGMDPFDIARNLNVPVSVVESTIDKYNTTQIH